MKIQDFYTSVLKAANLVVDDAGKVSAFLDGTSLPFTVGGKRLVLPTKEHLSNPDKTQIVLFHPLKENILTGESDVMARYRKAINVSTNYTISTLLTSIISLAASPALHGKLTPDQLEIIRVFKDADEKTLDAFKAILKAMPQGDKDKTFVNIFMKTKATLNGKVHRRGAIVTFPFYDELIKATDSSIYGVKLRKKDFASIKHVFEVVFPSIAQPNAYSCGSQSETAPTLDALLRSLQKLFGDLAATIEEMKSSAEELVELCYDTAWAEMVDNFSAFDAELRLLPMQAGNEGGVVKAEAPAATAPAQTTIQGWGQMQQPAPNQMPAPPAAPVTKDGKLDLKSLGQPQQPQQQGWFNGQPQQPQGFGAWGNVQLPAGWGAPLQGPEAVRAGGYAGGRYSAPVNGVLNSYPNNGFGGYGL